MAQVPKLRGDFFNAGISRQVGNSLDRPIGAGNRSTTRKTVVWLHPKNKG